MKLVVRLLLAACAAGSTQAAVFRHRGGNWSTLTSLTTLSRSSAAVRGLPPVDVVRHSNKVPGGTAPPQETKVEPREDMVPKYHQEFAYAGCLLGGIAVVMAIFYLVHSPREEVRGSAWQVLNMSFSIFCAVLIYGLIREVLVKLLQLGPDVALPMWHTVGIFLLTYLLFQATLAFTAFATSGWVIKAAGGLFAHITGFAASFLTAEIQFKSPFRHSVFLTFLVAIAAGLVLALMNWASGKVREIIIKHGKASEEEEIWEHATEGAENAVLALSMGFALMQSFRFLVVGRSQPFEPDDEPENIRQWETNALLGCGFLFAVLVSATAVFNSRFLNKFPAHSLPWHFVAPQPTVMSMGMAWSLLFWGEWQVYCLGFNGIRIAGCLVVALLMSFLAVLAVFGLDALKTATQTSDASGTAIKQLVLAVGLIVGFTWERCFDMGLSTISEMHGRYGYITTHLMQLGLLLIMLPAWSQYILPKCG